MNTRTVVVMMLLAVAPATTGTRPAFAQAVQDDATTKAARARFQEGVAFFDQGQYENARAAFLQAYALRKHPAVLINLAQSSLKSAHVVDAANYFSQYLRESTGLTPAQKDDAEKGLAEARAKLGRIEVVAPTGWEVTVDSDRVGVAPLPGPLDAEPGVHKVSIRGSDGTTDTRTVMVSVGQEASAKFVSTSPLPPLAPPPEPTPDPAPSPEPGEQEPTPPPQEHKPPPARSGHSFTPTFVGAGIGVAGLATAIVLGISKGSAQSSADTVSGEIRAAGGGAGTCYSPAPGSRFYNACTTLASNNNQVNSDATVANVAVVVGVAGAVFAVAWGLYARRHANPRPSPTSLAPFVAPHSGGLGFLTSF